MTFYVFLTCLTRFLEHCSAVVTATSGFERCGRNFNSSSQRQQLTDQEEPAVCQPGMSLPVCLPDRGVATGGISVYIPQSSLP